MSTPRLLRRIAATAVAVVAVLSAVPVTRTPVASALNPNLFTLTGEAGDYIIGAQSLSYSDFTVSGGTTGVTVGVTAGVGGSVWWDVRLYPPSGTSLAPGFYEDATRWPFQAPEVPGLEVSGSGRGCNRLSGRFVVDEITFNPDSSVKSLVAHWEQHCENGSAASFGTVSWNGSTAVSPMNTVGPGDFTPTVIDSTSITKPQVITNTGGTPLPITSATITGTDAAQFQITSDPCSGRSIPVGGTCSIQVHFVPTQMGVSKANLTVVDASHPGGVAIPLRGKAGARVSSFWREGEHGDFLTGEKHQSYPVLGIFGAADSGSLYIATADLTTQIGSADFAPLAVGAYEDAQRFDFASAGHPRFDQSGQGVGCNTVAARFVIDQIVYGTNGELSRLAVHWESHCDGLPEASFGGVNYNSTVPFVERSINPRWKDFGAIGLGTTASQAVTVSNAGPSPLHVATASLVGVGADQFDITSDSCTGATVAKNATCTVTVRFSPTSLGTHSADLTIVDDVAQAAGLGSGQKVHLRGSADGRPNMYLEGEADDSMVGPDHIDLTDVQVIGNNTSIFVIGHEGADTWHAVIEAPAGGVLAAGANIATQQLDGHDAAHGGLGVFWNNQTCATATGRVAIQELTFNPDNTVASMVARWEYHCDGEAASSFGGVRFNSASPFAVTALTDTAQWEQVPNGTLGATKDIVLTSTGGDAAVGAVTLKGADASQFQIVSDGCSNTTVGGGSACTVQVRFAPTAANIGEKVARLVVPHTGALLGLGGTGQDVELRGSSTVAAASNFGELTMVNPARLMDTAAGIGAPRALLGPKATATLQVAGRGGVPLSGAGSVIVNVTTRRSTSNASSLIVWPAGTTRPAVASLVPQPGLTVSNLMTVRLGTGGKIQVYNGAGSTDVAIDIVGWYSGSGGPNGARFRPLSPTRAVNTTAGIGAPKAAIGAGATLKIDLRKKGGIPTSGAVAVALNVSAVRPTRSGALTVFPGDRLRPGTPALSFTPGVTVSNMVIVRLPASGVVQFFNSAGATHLAVDVLGYWTLAPTGNAGRYVPVTQTRLYDTRRLDGPQPAGSRDAYQIGGWAGIAHDATAAALNVVALSPTSAGYLRVFPDHVCTMPGTASVSYTLGRTVASGVFSPLSPLTFSNCAVMPAAVDIYNSAGTTNVLVEASGYFTP